MADTLASCLWFQQSQHVLVQIAKPSEERIYAWLTAPLLLVELRGPASQAVLRLPDGLPATFSVALGQNPRVPLQQTDFVTGPSLSPVLDDSRVLRWIPSGWQEVQLRNLRWRDGQLRESRRLCVPASQCERQLNKHATQQAHLLLTPSDASGKQGATESLVVPAVRPRVEVRFCHVWEGQRPYLRVQVDASACPQPPQGDVLWRRLNFPQQPRTYPLRWTPSRTAQVDLKGIEIKDKAAVQLNVSDASLPPQLAGSLWIDERRRRVLQSEGDVVIEYEYLGELEEWVSS